jgi:hypothetical protein
MSEKGDETSRGGSPWRSLSEIEASGQESVERIASDVLNSVVRNGGRLDVERLLAWGPDVVRRLLQQMAMIVAARSQMTPRPRNASLAPVRSTADGIAAAPVRVAVATPAARSVPKGPAKPPSPAPKTRAKSTPKAAPSKAVARVERDWSDQRRRQTSAPLAAMLRAALAAVVVGALATGALRVFGL